MVTLMEWYQVLLLIVVLLAFFYVATFVYVFGQIHEFRLRLRRRTNGLNLLLSQRRDVIMTIVALLEKDKVSINEEDEACFAKISALGFVKPNEDTIRADVALIKEATSRLRAIYQSNEGTLNQDSYRHHFELLDDLEKNYRSLIGLYNADAVAYNYWIHIPLFTFIAKAFQNRPRAMLN